MIAMLMLSTAAAVTCPSPRDAAPLVGFALFDGPVADNAILAPDTSRRSHGVLVQTWRVDGVYRAGRSLTLRCDYPRRLPLFVPVTRRMTTCQARWHAAGPSLSCR
jgi:hypothetical protein